METSGIPQHLSHGCARERADRIQRSVAQDLYPDFVPNASRDRAAQAGGDESFGNLAGAFGARAVRLAESNAIALNVLNNPWRGNLGRKVNDRSNYTARFDGRGNDAVGIDTLKAHSFPRAAEALEVPPRNSILRADDCGVRP